MEMKLIIKYLSIAVLYSCLTVSCGENQGGVSRHVRDRKAYQLGQEHAEAVIHLKDDESRLQDALLDVRAHMTNIKDRIGAQASADYERGFVDYIKVNDDSLAVVLF